MTDPLLQIYLMACMVVAMAILVFWGQFRKRLKLSAHESPDKLINYKRIKRVSSVFWIIFSLFGIMIIIYCVAPDLYFLFVPLDAFHHPLINNIGLLITKLAIAWIIVAQIHIDKELFKYSRDIESLSAMELVSYSEGMLLSGMLVLFLGIFTTITNVVGVILTVIGVLFFVKGKIYKAYYLS
ncbi:hypothetical protein AAOE16_08265 [Ekhidna sp. MALMAid0563]|uniref:hypothetical protein n=1 Tax=Ekhidna sp. MALMAid0563 TaxID=3143937 RepID=UPI0032DFD045